MTDQKITMDGKWAYRYDPVTQVRILCVDRNSEEYPVVSMFEDNDLPVHTAEGLFWRDGREDPFDLVPLQVKRQPREVWVSADGNMVQVHVDGSIVRPPDGTVIFREIMDGE